MTSYLPRRLRLMWIRTAVAVDGARIAAHVVARTMLRGTS
jgi:hypothetical protein